MVEHKTTYLLFLSQDNELEKTIFLGAGENPVSLFKNALNPLIADENYKSLILNWLIKVEFVLNEQEKNDMDFAFMHNPQTEFSYTIKDLTLYIKLINQY